MTDADQQGAATWWWRIGYSMPFSDEHGELTLDYLNALERDKERLAGELSLASRSIHVAESHKGDFEGCSTGLCPQRRAALEENA